MQKENLTLLAQLLTGIKDAISKLESAYKKKDIEMLALAKKEILSFQSQIDKLI